MDNPNQLRLFESPQNDQPMERNLLSLSEEDCRELSNLFAKLLINFLNRKKETQHADDTL